MPPSRSPARGSHRRKWYRSNVLPSSSEISAYPITESSLGCRSSGKKPSHHRKRSRLSDSSPSAALTQKFQRCPELVLRHGLRSSRWSGWRFSPRDRSYLVRVPKRLDRASITSSAAVTLAVSRGVSPIQSSSKQRFGGPSSARVWTVRASCSRISGRMAHASAFQSASSLRRLQAHPPPSDVRGVWTLA